MAEGGRVEAVQADGWSAWMRGWGAGRLGWWAAGLGAAAVMLMAGVAGWVHLHDPKPMREVHSEQADILADSSSSRAPVAAAKRQNILLQTALTTQSAPGMGQMVARTVSLTLRVVEAGAARAKLEAVLARHGGFTAQMNANTSAGAARVFTTSLRIPAGQLEPALKELRGLGTVETESQTGEEVSQQHQDLAIRLTTAQETEGRLRGILQQRTGSVSDVLEVEQEIARVRGEIERMEAEQAGLERRVEFAAVDLSMAEAAQFAGAADSAGARLRDGFVAGFRNARETLLAMAVFVEEYGPAMLIWMTVLGAGCASVVDVAEAATGAGLSAVTFFQACVDAA